MPGLFDIPELKRAADIREIRPWLNQLRDAIIALRPVSSGGLRVNTTAQGTRFSGRLGSGSGSLEFPFQITQSDSNKILVRSGTLQDIIPTSVGADYTLSTDGTHTVYLDATINSGGSITAAALGSATTGKPADTSTHAYITLGTVVVASSEITSIAQAVTHSLRFRACDRDSGDPTTTPGTYHFWGV